MCEVCSGLGSKALWSVSNIVQCNQLQNRGAWRLPKPEAQAIPSPWCLSTAVAQVRTCATSNRHRLLG
jgi:hypothetical protein